MGRRRDTSGLPQLAHSFAPGAMLQKRIALLNHHRRSSAYEVSWRVTLGGETLASDTQAGTLAATTQRFLPVSVLLPARQVELRRDGTIELTARIGDTTHKDSFAFRVFAPTSVTGEVQCHDPAGKTRAMLESLGLRVSAWRGTDIDTPLVIGRDALSRGDRLPGDLAALVRAGGRVVVMGQSPAWLRERCAFRVGHYVLRRVFRADASHAVVEGLDDRDLENWAGSGTLIEAYPPSDETDRSGYGYPPYGWHWGNRGSVTSASVEKPHFTSWRPILECDFDLAHTPLMEMEFGRGRVILCTLDLEDNVPLDAAATRLAANIFRYAAEAPIAPKVDRILYIGGDEWAKRLANMGVVFEHVARLPAQSRALIIDPGANVDETVLTGLISAGARALVLPSSAASGPLGLQCQRKGSIGSFRQPTWPETAGITISDLRARAQHDAWLVTGGDGIEIAADGLIARRKIGRGSVIFAQTDADRFNADEITYFRFSRWRQTRALSQLLSNMGGVFAADATFFSSAVRPPSISLNGRWHARRTGPLPSATGKERHRDPGLSREAEEAVSSGFVADGWAQVAVPGPLEACGDEWQGDGETVLLRDVQIPDEWVGRELELTLGAIDDFDVTFVNGTEVGRTGAETPGFWTHPRRYRVPASLTEKRTLRIAIRAFDHFGNGGLMGPKLSLGVWSDATMARLYHPDYRDDFPLGDDPHRYYRW